MEQNPSLPSRLDVTANHPPMGFIYAFFTPTITVNGQVYKRPWGTSSFDLPPGDYEVSVSYPWIFAPECGKNTVSFTLHHGETKRVSYRAGLIRYLPGKISVS
jgi:hypothetical protein